MTLAWATRGLRAVALITALVSVTGWPPPATRPALAVSGLTTEHATDPLGVDAARPVLAWQLTSAARAQRQTAYEIEVFRGARTVWDSGRVAAADPFAVPYGGPALTSATRYDWRVRVWDSRGRRTPWSARAHWETGLLSAADWSGARWIGGPAGAGLPRWPAGSSVTASSSHARGGVTYDTGNAVDGNPATFWNDDTEAAFPDWLAVRTPAAVLLSGVTLYSAPEGGPSDLDVQTWQDDRWVTRRHLTGITAAHLRIPFDEPVSTTGVRIQVNADWEQDTRYLWTRIGELSPGLVAAAAYDTAAAPLLRTTFAVDKPVRRARLYVSGLAYYQAYLNGRRVGDAVLDPAFTMYDHRVYYATHDVTALVTPGVNAIGAELGRGFYGLTDTTPWWNWTKAAWHHEPQLRAKLVVTYADGTATTVTTGDGWRTSSGPRLFDSVYTGEDYDARRAQPGWQTAAFDAATWSPAPVVDAPAGVVQAQSVEPIRVTDTFPATAVTSPAPGTYVFDFGRTTAGWAALTDVAGPAGTRITLRYAERLNPDGTILGAGDYAGRPLATDAYVLAGGAPESWEPAFSWQSFRYVQVTGLPAAPGPGTLIGKAVHTDAAVVGTFQSSDPLHNAIHAAAVRTVQNNMQSVLSDTPTWEKNGWLDDATLGSQFIPLSVDVQRFFAKWATDMRDTQVPSGAVTLIAPSNGNGLDSNYPWGPAPEWQAGYPALVWALYQQYGDPRPLSDNYDALIRYTDYELGALDSSGLARTSLGDWAAPEATSDPQVTATAYAFRSVQTMAGIAAALHRTADAARFTAAAGRLRDAFDAAFYRPELGYYQSPAEPAYRQATNAIPLAFGLVPPARAAAVADHLAADVARRGDHLATGSIGTAAMLSALTRNGQPGTAARLVAQTTYPSWGNMLAHGGDTLFESWDPDVRSRNHLYFGAAVEQWFFEDLAGLRRDAPGWARLLVAPVVPAGVTSAAARIDTVRGAAASAWHTRPDGTLLLDVTVPVGATAEVRVPGAGTHTIGSGTYHFTGRVPAAHVTGRVPAAHLAGRVTAAR